MNMVLFIFIMFTSSPDNVPQADIHAYSDRGECEYVRAEQQALGYTVSDKCDRVELRSL